MRDIADVEMVRCIANMGGLGILHRFMDYDYLKLVAYKLINEFPNNVGFSVGVQKEDYDLVDYLIANGVKIICIDVAHGHHVLVKDMLKFIRDRSNDVLVIAGNVASGAGAKFLWNNGANIVKLGVGSGSLCSTRIATGNGVPQFTALCEAWEAFEQFQYIEDKAIISDGSIKTSGDILKALTKSHMVMGGGIFAGCLEAPGKTVTINGIQHKEYSGSSTHKTNYIEGVSAAVPAKGSAVTIINTLLEGIRSGCSYQGSSNLEELKVHPEFVKVSSSGLKESHPHNPYVIK